MFFLSGKGESLLIDKHTFLDRLKLPIVLVGSMWLSKFNPLDVIL